MTLSDLLLIGLAVLPFAFVVICYCVVAAKLKTANQLRRHSVDAAADLSREIEHVRALLTVRNTHITELDRSVAAEKERGDHWLARYQDRQKEYGDLLLIATRLQDPTNGFLPSTGDEPEWKPYDSAMLRDYLASTPGTHFRLLLNFHEQRINRQSVKLSEDPVRACGYATGWHDCANFVMNQLPVAVPPKEDETEQQREGDSALRERVSP